MKVVLVGVGGYGRTYARRLLEENSQIEFVGAVDPFIEQALDYEEIKARGIPIYSDLKDFYEHQQADIAIISTPIQFHCEQSCYALEKGSYVLCEKPLSATIQDAYQMMEMEQKTNRFIAIGYQWSYTNAIQNLKKDILNDIYGKAQMLKTYVLWPRNRKYYSRGCGWAASKKDKAGRWVLDGPVNNATSHYLHNMLYVLGKESHLSAMPASVEAELYRANDVENYDTGVLRCITEDGVELNYFASHSVERLEGPIFEYTFEKGVIRFDNKRMWGTTAEGKEIDYGSPNDESRTNKLDNVVEAIKTQGRPLLGVQGAMAQTLCINLMQESMPEAKTFSSDLVKETPDEDTTLVYVEGLFEDLRQCYQSAKLPHELGFSWASAGEKIGADGYMSYPSRVS